MNKRFKSDIVFFLLLSFASVLSAKSDFRAGIAITLTNDTLFGLIDYEPDAKLCESIRIKINEADQVNEFNANVIKEFQFINEHRKFIKALNPFISNSSEVYFEVLDEGKLNLYYWIELNSTVQFFVRKSDETHLYYLPFNRSERYVDNGRTKRFRTIDTTDHIDTLKKVMQDQPSLFTEIEKINIPQRENLYKLVRKYNNNNKTINQNKSNTKAAFTPRKCFLTPQISYVGLADAAFDNLILLGGIDFSIQVIPFNQLVFFHTGLTIPIRIRGNNTDNNIFSNNQSKGVSIFKIPLLFEFRFPGRLIQPCLSVGNNFYIINNDLSTDTHFIPTLSGGVILNVNKRIAFSIISSFEFSPYLLNYLEYDNFCLSAGLQIKL